MRTRIRRLLAAVAAILGLSAAAATAQTITGHISGTAADTSGGILPGVTIVVTEEDTGFTQTTATDERGAYVFVNLPIGNYKVTAEWSINVPLVCGAWIKLFGELIGKNDIKPFDLAKSFYYRAYFNMGTIGKIFEHLGLPSNTIELLMEVECTGSEKPSFKPTRRTLTLLPRMLRCVYQKLWYKNDIEAFLPSMRKAYESFPIHELKSRSAKELIHDLERLYALNEQTAYFMIITYLIMGLFHGLFKHQLKKYGFSFEDFDLTGGMEDLKNYDPTVKLFELNSRFNQINETTKKDIAEGTYADFLILQGADTFKKEVKDFIEDFGYLSDSGNDFSS